MKKDSSDRAKNPLRKELENYKKQGVELRLDGQPSTPKTITQACRIAEDGNYMRDYTCGTTDDIEKIDFVFVKQKF